MATADPYITRRIDEAATRRKAHPALAMALEHFGDYDMAAARRPTESNTLYQLLAEHDLLDAIEAVTGWCLDDERERIVDEARSECSYSIPEECYYSDDGDLILDGSRPTNLGYADYVTDLHREGGAA